MRATLRSYLCYLPGDRFQLKFAMIGMQEGAQYMWEKVQKRLAAEPSVDVHDYIDAYLIEKRKLEHDKKDFSTFCGASSYSVLIRYAHKFAVTIPYSTVELIVTLSDFKCRVITADVLSLLCRQAAGPNGMGILRRR